MTSPGGLEFVRREDSPSLRASLYDLWTEVSRLRPYEAVLDRTGFETRMWDSSGPALRPSAPLLLVKLN